MAPPGLRTGSRPRRRLGPGVDAEGRPFVLPAVFYGWSADGGRDAGFGPTRFGRTGRRSRAGGLAPRPRWRRCTPAASNSWTRHVIDRVWAAGQPRGEAGRSAACATDEPCLLADLNRHTPRTPTALPCRMAAPSMGPPDPRRGSRTGPRRWSPPPDASAQDVPPGRRHRARGGTPVLDAHNRPPQAQNRPVHPGARDTIDPPLTGESCSDTLA